VNNQCGTAQFTRQPIINDLGPGIVALSSSVALLESVFCTNVRASTLTFARLALVSVSSTVSLAQGHSGPRLREGFAVSWGLRILYNKLRDQIAGTVMRFRLVERRDSKGEGKGRRRKR